MPTYLRLIIMLVEIIVFIIFSIVIVKKCDCKRREKFLYTEEYLNQAKRTNKYFLIAFNVIIIIAFFFSYPHLIFLSYNKMIGLSLIFVASILTFLGYYILEADLTVEYKVTVKNVIGIILISLGIFVLFFGLIRELIQPFTNEYLQFRTCIDQDETVETIYPEFIGDSKIGYDRSTGKYIFGVEDDEGNWSIIYDCEIEPDNIKSSDNTYIVKHRLTKTFIDLEREKESDNYIVRESEDTYVLFLNKKQLISVEDN